MNATAPDAPEAALSGAHQDPIDLSPALHLWMATAVAHGALEEILSDAVMGGDVGGADVVAILLPLARADGQRLRMHQLAEQALLTPSGLTRRIDRLEHEGLVRRVSCPADRRGAHAELTDVGLQTLRRSVRHLGEVLDGHVAARLSPAETRTMAASLQRLSRPPGSD